MTGKRHHSTYFFFLIHPVEGDMCDRLGVELHNEVALACPLTANVYNTKHSIVIKYFKDANNPEDVLGCDWLSSSQEFDCLRSRVDAKLIKLQSDRVLARLPKDSLGNGPYRCQLVPPNLENFLTDCVICDQDSTSGNPTTQSSVIPAAPADQHGSNNPREKTCGYAVGNHGGLVTAVAVLSIIVFCLLLTMAAMVVFFLWYRRRMNWKRDMARTRTTSSSTESNVREDRVKFSLLMPSKAAPGLEEDKSRMSNNVRLNLYPDINHV